MSEMFELATGGVGTMPDPDDNPDGHDVPHHDAGTRISFEVRNAGDASGTARVGVEVDDTFIQEWPSPSLLPGESTPGYVKLGRLSQGEHTILIYVNPGAGTIDHAESVLNVA
ncbi:hypothetical protein [Streptomyces sp. NPDC048057]|uniref:hypothetical protein n=1 Tax=Streptomyces sp. NPDC048057 TaxID=3155628 RepID=UPI003405F609